MPFGTTPAYIADIREYTCDFEKTMMMITMTMTMMMTITMTITMTLKLLKSSHLYETLRQAIIVCVVYKYYVSVGVHDLIPRVGESTNFV